MWSEYKSLGVQAHGNQNSKHNTKFLQHSWVGRSELFLIYANSKRKSHHLITVTMLN